MASYQQHGGYRSQPTATMPHAQQQQPQWTPQLVDELLFRQFMKGEDVTALVPPPPTAPSGPLALPDSIRALQRYVMGGGSTAAGGPAAIAAAQRAAATGATGNAPGTPHRAGTPVASSSAAAAAGGGARTPVNARRPNQPGPAAAGAHGGAPRTPTAAESKSRPLPDVENTPPVSHNQQQPAYGTAATAGAKRPLTDSTPSSATNAGSGANAGVNPPSSPRTATTVNTNNNSKAHARPAENRRVAWPTDAPQDAQLKGTSRSALQPVTQARLRAQERVDPDWIFAQPLQDFPVAEIFGTYPDAAKLIKALRGISGDWRQDTFTEVEELSYKESMGYSPGAPSQANDVLQAAYGRVNGTQQANGPSSSAVNQLPMPPPLRQPVPAMPAVSKHGALHHLDGEIGLA
jgi:hypothetical protein